MGRRVLILSAFMMAFVTTSRGEIKKPASLPKDVAFIGNHLYKKGQVLVRRKQAVKMQEMAMSHATIGAKVSRTFASPRGLELVKLPEGMPIEKAIEFYQRDSRVLYVEPDYYVHTQGATNDAKFAQQWALNNTGQTNGTADADVNGPEMWDLSTGRAEVVLGVIDTGVLYTHPDLKANAWVNAGEIAGNNIDDDNNGFVDDIHGISAITKKGDPRDDNGHGTHVAGIIGAVGNNGVGTSGINQKISILGCKFLDSGGGGSTSDALTCMDYMLKLKKRADHPVNIVATNNSWAGGGFSQAMVDAIKTHKDAGILFIAAASNEGDDNDVTETYPANYPSSNIISVAATDRNDNIASFSNFGRHSVHVSAPGVDILSTVLGNDYEEYSGTSMAAPHVTGMAGLLKSFNPDLDWKSIKNLIIAGGQPIAAVKNNTISGRRLRGASQDGTGSLTCVNQVVKSRLSPQGNSMTIPLGQAVDFSLMNINCAIPNGAPNMPAIEEGIRLIDDGQGSDSAADDGIYTAQWSPSKAGNYTFDFGDGDVVSVNVYNATGWRAYRATTPSEYSYRSISGTKLEMSDDSVVAINSPFPIRFAGDEGGFTSLNVGSNGALSFTEAVVPPWENQSLPATSYQSLVAPFWDDLNPSRVGGVYYEVIGQAPNRELVVEWRGVPHFDSSDPVTFQVVFFEKNSDILFNYADVKLSSPAHDGGASATIGVQISSSSATQQGLNQAIVTDNSALLFVQD